MIDFESAKRNLLERQDVKQAYEALADEFEVTEALIKARVGAKLTQSQLAERMQTSQSYVARLESGRISPSLGTLKRYAAATGTTLKVSFDERN